MTARERIVILGAAGRDFHDFNVLYREDPDVEVVAFTAAQIPGIAARHYPPELSGPFHPEGIPILPESQLEELIRAHEVGRVVFAYSDVPHDHVMHLASRSIACGADFELPGPERTMLQSRLPVVAVSAVRTGCGKSQTARYLAARLRARGHRVAAIRHPMPYGNLLSQRVQRFAEPADLDAADCTLEEREEYEPYIEARGVVFAGVDYAEILKAAEAECDVVIWDGGNNDFPFIRPDLHVVLVDALRPDHLATHHPGEAVLRMADVVVIAKSQTAAPEQLALATEGVHAICPDVQVIRAASPVVLDDPEAVRGRRVVVVDDGPTLTHGGMPYGAGFRAAVEAGAHVADPRRDATSAFRKVFETYPHLERVLPAMGYGPEQLEELQRTILAANAEAVIAGTPIDLAARIDLPIPIVRARYRFAEVEDPGLGDLVDCRVDELLQKRGDEKEEVR